MLWQRRRHRRRTKPAHRARPFRGSFRNVVEQQGDLLIKAVVLFGRRQRVEVLQEMKDSFDAFALPACR